MISLMVELSASLFDSIFCVYFILRFNHCTWRQNKFSIPTALVLFLCTVFFDYNLSDAILPQTFLLLGTSIAFSLTIANVSRGRAILSAFMFKTALVTLSAGIYSILGLVVRDFQILLAGSASVSRFVLILLHKLLLFSLLQLILRIFQTNHPLTPAGSLWAFLFTVITAVGLKSVLQISFHENAKLLYPHILAIALSFIIVNIIFFSTIHMVMRLQKIKYEEKALEEKAKFEQIRYQDMLAVYDNVRKLRHDINQHLFLLSHHLDKGDVESCQTYIESLLPEIKRTEHLFLTGNDMIDYLIHSKLEKHGDIEFTITGTAWDMRDIKEVDLVSLIGNILDNAIKAEQNVCSPRIELIFDKHNANRFLCCKNRIKASVLQGNPGLKTSKVNSFGHGYGCRIIREIVKKYHGTVDFFEEDGMFGVRLILPSP